MKELNDYFKPSYDPEKFKYWEDSRGHRVYIKDMDDSYIRSVIAKIERSKCFWRPEWLEPMRDELKSRKTLN